MKTSTARTCFLITKGSSIAAIVVGLLVLGAWLFDVNAPKSVLPGESTTKANTALCFALIGLALWLLCNYIAEDIAAGKPERKLAQAVAEGRSQDELWRLHKDGSRLVELESVFGQGSTFRLVIPDKINGGLA
ncbi:MAG: hypothetical protein ACRD9S_07235 [Pyrinomonadaceae bacterium]